MDTEASCGGGSPFTTLAPAKQAEYLALLAQDARLAALQRANGVVNRGLDGRRQRQQVALEIVQVALQVF